MSPPSPDPPPAPPAARPPRPRSPVASLDTIRLILAPALVFIVTGLDRGYQTELWQHLARGRLVARHHEVVSFDTFTFTVPGRPFVDNNWLTQLLYHALHTAGGLELLQFANALTLAAAVALLVWHCRRESGSTRTAGVLGAVAFLGLWQTLLIRPQSVSMLLFVALHVLLTAAARGRVKLLALVLPMMALWANVHGGFAVGLVLVFTFAAPIAWRHVRRALTRLPSDPPAEPIPPPLPWLACLAAGFLATLLNPYGVSVYRYAGQLSTLGVARGIEEWLPPSPASLVGASFFLSVAVAAVLLAAARRRVTLHDALVLACFAAPAFLSVRMTVWWFLAAAPVAARLTASLWDHHHADDVTAATAPRPSRPAVVAVSALAALCGASLPWLERHSPLFGALRPAHRTESDLRALAASLTAPAPPSSPEPRVFARMEWSNYLAWQTGGRAKVFAEGHVELYPADTWSDYITVNDARPGWDQVLDRYGVRYLVLDQAYHAALQAEVRRSSDWSEKARSGDAVLFERRARGAPGLSPSVAGAAPAGEGR